MAQIQGSLYAEVLLYLCCLQMSFFCISLIYIEFDLEVVWCLSFLWRDGWR